MKFLISKFLLNLFILIASATVNSSIIAQLNNNFITNEIAREHILLDTDWRFAFGHAYDTKKDFNHATGYFSYLTKSGFGDGPASKIFDDRSWRNLNLPHDWAVEMPFDPKAGYSHGFKTVGRNFPETSVGWYRKTFIIPNEDLNKRISIQFDGVHRNSRVWINGFYLGEEHSGYYNFEYDITDYLNYGGENVIAVRADVTMEEGWYYEGAGIYRHVWLNKTNPLHITTDGIFVHSKVKEASAEVTVNSTIINKSNSKEFFEIDQIIVDNEGNFINQESIKNVSLEAGEMKDFSCILLVNKPHLWSPESPYLYKLTTKINSEKKIIDYKETPFGIRTISFDADKGFFLNGKHYLLKGTNNHQDHAGVGTAIPDALQEFRIKKLKEMGANAYRASHNPPTPELLEICDRLGMFVIDENRLMGTTNEHLDLLKRMILRDRNHPSVLIWSIGNEEWGMEGSVTGARIASTMQKFVQQLDPTRRVTYAHSGWGDNGIGTVQDVMGFNYIFNGDIDKQHKNFPHQPSIGTEETTSRSTRGIYSDDPENGHLAPTDRKPNGRSLEEGFKFYAARPFLSGIFYWTGFDHRGEPNPYGWPQVSSHSGILDLCGFPKDMFYYLKSWWTDTPTLHIFPHWNWNEGDSVNVWAYSNCDEVELLLNGKSLGKKNMPVHSHLEWNVVYEKGILSAIGFNNGKEVLRNSVETTGKSSEIKLIADRLEISGDGSDVSVITVQVNDSAGRIVPTADNEISFSIEGEGKIIGVGNGNPSSHEADRFVEDVKQILINDLKAKLVPAKNYYEELELNFDDSDWPSALNEQGNYNVRSANELKNALIRGSFWVSDFNDKTEFTLWPKSLGEIQAVYINGKLIADGIKRNDPVNPYKISGSILKKGKNIFAVVCSPLVERFLYDNLNTDPGLIQVTNPPSKWKRKVFNGLAQIIVQSKSESGKIILTAESDRLKKDSIKILVTYSSNRVRVKSK